MISAGLEGRLPYNMTYPEPWRGPPPKQPPEFLRPAPKPATPANRYNGSVTTSPSGPPRLVPPQRPLTKYATPTPVNLTQQQQQPHKEDTQDDLHYIPYRGFHPPFTPYAPFTTMYQPHYTHMLRSTTFPTTPTPLPPIDTYSTITTSTFLSPPTPTFSPPQNILRDKRGEQAAFKVPSGKEGSLKHRILTRPEDNRHAPLDLQKIGTGENNKNKNRTSTVLSPPPKSPKKINNNNSVPGNFNKGSLIQLTSGELRKIEDMRTEDFVSSAENSAELRLADSTVVRIEEHYATGTATITLSYNERRTQVEVESPAEHPFFVFGQGWASCSPERTHQCYQLKVHRLQVGDILISLTPREPGVTYSSSTTTITNTADQPIDLHSRPLSPESMAAKKRRWSAPDDICDDVIESATNRRQRVE